MKTYYQNYDPENPTEKMKFPYRWKKNLKVKKNGIKNTRGKHMNEFGLPLDSRADYTKSDWLVWSASMAPDKETFKQLIAPLAGYLRATPDRVPFSDWYDTVTSVKVGFQPRTVQGGLFMKLLDASGKMRYKF